MALKQNITSVSGATTEYHRISGAVIDFTARKANITVLSYVDAGKREEEKNQTSKDNDRQAIMDELNTLVANPTEDNEARRNELSEELNALEIPTPEDVAPRSLLESNYTIEMATGSDFTLELAYSWLKANIYTDAEDC